MDMKKLLMIVAIISSVLLSGCSLLEEVNNSLEYANKATEHINTWQDFGQEAPQMIQEAATNPETKQELEAELNALLEEIDEFNQTEPPAIAADLHQQIVEKNEALQEIINDAMVNGELALEELQNSELITTINEITKLMNLVEDLGN
jgi:PBP1b-binding outer membrane lipoprotein LpoB